MSCARSGGSVRCMSGDGFGAQVGPGRARVWLGVPYAEKDEARTLGARWDSQARRWYVPADRAEHLTAWRALPPLPVPLPGEDRNFGSGLFVDLIPSSCWFTNVRTCVRPADWERVKALVVGRAGQRCEACGGAAEPSHGLWLEAHERWSYDDATRVQTLRRLVCLCTRCHRSTHFGFAEVTGQAAQAHAHLCAVNGWSTADADAHIAMAARTWRARSAIDWTLDLSVLTAAGVVPSPAPTAPNRRRIAGNTLDRTTRHNREELDDGPDQHDEDLRP
jgi:hypothetical protein